MLGWSLFAFGGTYSWTVVPIVVGAAALAAVERPDLFGRTTLLDAALLAALAVVALQLVPLTAGLREAFSPAAVAFDRALRVGGSGMAAPLSIDPANTVGALLLALSGVLLFWTARSTFQRTGLRATCRAVGWMGLAASAIAIVQHAMAPKLLYGYFRPLSASASPFGPFVNRNDFATWVILALPLTTGYAIARIQARRGRSGSIGVQSIVDDTEVWLAGAVLLMTIALVVSASRSGAIGATAGMCTLVWLTRNRTAATGHMWLVGSLATIALVAVTYVSTGELASRFGEASSRGVDGRSAIWRDTMPMIADFSLTGVGAGAYEHAMLLYQRGPRAFYFNHAHDEYLQIAAEGGLLLAVPAALALGAGLWTAVRRMRSDRSAVFWIRAGALGGICGVLVQNVWDTGLRMPANGLLFAVLCAMAVHQGRAPADAERDRD